MLLLLTLYLLVSSAFSQPDTYPDCDSKGWLMGEDYFFFNSSTGMGSIPGAPTAALLSTYSHKYVTWANNAFCKANHNDSQMAYLASDTNVRFFNDVLRSKLRNYNSAVGNTSPYTGMINRANDATFDCPFWQDKDLCFTWIDGSSVVPFQPGSTTILDWSTPYFGICVEYWLAIPSTNNQCDEAPDPASCSVSGKFYLILFPF
jgi:hypothetical protein